MGYIVLVLMAAVMLLIDFLIIFFMFRRSGRPAGLDGGR